MVFSGRRLHSQICWLVKPACLILGYNAGKPENSIQCSFTNLYKLILKLIVQESRKQETFSDYISNHCLHVWSYSHTWSKQGECFKILKKFLTVYSFSFSSFSCFLQKSILLLCLVFLVPNLTVKKKTCLHVRD